MAQHVVHPLIIGKVTGSNLGRHLIIIKDVKNLPTATMSDVQCK